MLNYVKSQLKYQRKRGMTEDRTCLFQCLVELYHFLSSLFGLCNIHLQLSVELLLTFSYIYSLSSLLSTHYLLYFETGARTALAPDNDLFGLISRTNLVFDCCFDMSAQC